MEEKDIWRDTPVRLLGYTNEVGESFRYIFPKLVKPSYAVATGYCVCDVIDKALKARRKNEDMKKVGLIALDAFVWQILASVAVPGFTIHKTVKISTWVLNRVPSASK
jgi:fission process protein 1